MEHKREYIEPESYARRYQLEVFQRAKERNTIAYLETGSGKTLVAVLLIKAHANLIRKPNRGIAIFLCPKVCLVKQQADVLEIHTDLKVGQFWGAMGTDFWDQKTWQEQLAVYEVFVMTPQILLDNLRHCFFEMKMIKILIFDECHHARKKHPYACIMNEFYRMKSDLPLVFGMTASPKFSKDRLQSDLISLENMLSSRAAEIIETMKNEDNFEGYSFRPELLNSLSIKFLQEAKRILQSFLPTDSYHTVGDDLKSDVKSGLLTEKVEALVNIVQEYRYIDSWRSIVFVQRVIAAMVLARFLSTTKCLSPLKCEHLAGNNRGLSHQSHKVQQHIIDQFRYGELHLLVATNIVEEGLDIQKCNLVIQFDLPQTVSSWIQSRGRARKAGSQYVLLVERGNVKQKGLVYALHESEVF